MVMSATNLTTISSPLIVTDVDWQMAVLTIGTAVLTLANALVLIAIYRVSQNLHSFILFLSEGLANLWMLLAGSLSDLGQLFHFEPLGNQKVFEFLLLSMTAYASHLHYLLIAVNRAFTIFLPLDYDIWWTRENVKASVLLVWVVGSALQLVNVAQFAKISSIPLFMPIYGYVQRCVTAPSLTLYSAALLWVLFNRLLVWVKRYRSSVAPGSNGATTAASTCSVSYVHGVDLRIFAYCFISFLPNCYHIFAKPPMNSMHWAAYATIRIASPGLLLYVMSSPVREQMPRVSDLRCLQRGVQAANRRLFELRLRRHVPSIVEPIQTIMGHAQIAKQTIRHYHSPPAFASTSTLPKGFTAAAMNGSIERQLTPDKPISTAAILNGRSTSLSWPSNMPRQA